MDINHFLGIDGEGDANDAGDYEGDHVDDAVLPHHHVAEHICVMGRSDADNPEVEEEEPEMPESPVVPETPETPEVPETPTKEPEPEQEE